MKHSNTQSKSSNSDDLILTIDNGTQSIRALLFNLQGQLVGKSQIQLEAYFSEHPGWAEQHADYFWQMLGKCVQSLWQQPDVIAQELKSKVKSVTVTTQRGTVINLDANGKPLRPAILWLDQRLADKEALKKHLPWYWKVAFACAKQTPLIQYFYAKAQANWIAQNQPDIWQKTDKFLLLSGYLNYKLTGQFNDSIGSILGYLPFDYKKQQWADKRSWKWKLLPISLSMLSKLVKPGAAMGKLTQEARAALELGEEVEVYASASDKACEVLGSGCLEPSVASLSFGTTATINTNNANYVEPLTFIPPCPSAVPNHYNSEIMIYRGFWMVNWFKQEFGQIETMRAKELGVPTESLFDDLVNQVPAGSMGLTLQPYWSPGLKTLEAKGAMIGFGDVHTRAHIYRAILEGLAYALREGKERIERKQKQPITRLIASGGGSQSDAALQLTADIFNLPVHRPHTHETSGLGAAINVAVGSGYYADYQQAIAAMTSVKDTFAPIADNAKLYQGLYQNIYRNMYSRLKPLYLQIQKITGYPK